MKRSLLHVLLLSTVLAAPVAAGSMPETVEDCYELPGSNVELGRCLGDVLAVSEARLERAFHHAMREAEKAVRSHAMPEEGPRRLDCHCRA